MSSLQDAAEGRLCTETVDAVLAAAGHRVVKRARQLPAGLTERELDVPLARTRSAATVWAFEHHLVQPA